MMMSNSWIVSQIGARQHYAPARAFHQRGALRAFYTDLWCRWGSSMLRKGPRPVRAFAGRYNRELPSGKVTAFNTATFYEQLRHSRPSSMIGHARVGRSFAQRVTRHLQGQSLDPQRDAFFGFYTGCLETLQMLHPRQIFSIVNQPDAGRTYYEIVCEEVKRWPGWQDALQHTPPDLYFDRLRQEWDLASLVLVHSQFSRKALIDQGVAAEKIIVVPQAYEACPAKPRAQTDAPLAVLWVGNVALGKGIQYLIEAAKLLAESNIRITIAGSIMISDDAIASAPPNMDFIGRVTRDRALQLYCNADVFILPSLSEGLAMTQLEAMSHGVPVIATPNCGEVVTDGVDGLVVPIRNAQALATAICRLDDDRALLAEMSRQTLVKVGQFTVDRYANSIEQAVARYRQCAGT